MDLYGFNEQNPPGSSASKQKSKADKAASSSYQEKQTTYWEGFSQESAIFDIEKVQPSQRSTKVGNSGPADANNFDFLSAILKILEIQNYITLHN